MRERVTAWQGGMATTQANAEDEKEFNLSIRRPNVRPMHGGTLRSLGRATNEDQSSNIQGIHLQTQKQHRNNTILRIDLLAN